MSSRPVRVGIVVALLMVLVAACAPTFATGSALRATKLGPLVKLSWDIATDGDAGQTIARYQIEVDGVAVGSINAPSRACVLTGLLPSRTYSLSVTAYDSANEWSGPSASGRLTKSYRTPSTGGAGPTVACVAATDTDADRLPNAVENNNGIYANAASTGTNPNVADTDVDGLRDGDEVLGTTAGLNLPAMGARALKKNLIFEFDWFNDNLDPGTCGAHSHRPTAGAIGRLTTAFANAPVSNPDGTTGVKVISDYGQGGAFTGGNLVADADGVIAGGVDDTDFAAIKSANFASNRRSYVHYVLNPHRYDTDGNSSGQAEINGNDLVVSLYCFGSDVNVANTIMHEVGHNLGLRHGGNLNTNNKPNYNSVMNYDYQFPGVDTNCVLGGDGRLDYSTGSRASLNESALSETAGLCNGVDIDWNGNSSIDAGTVVADINDGDGFFQILADYNDWSNLNLGGVTEADGSPLARQEIVTEQPVPVN